MTTPDHSTRSQPHGAQLADYAMMIIVWPLGTASLVVFFFWFVPFGPPKLVDLALSETGKVALNTLLCLAFFLQHSGMVRRSFRRWTARFMPSRLDGAMYTIGSGVVLLALVALWQEAAHTLAAAEGVLRWVLRAVYVLSVAGFVWGIVALRSFDTFGLRPILDRLRGADSPPLPFTVRGPYRWVRHPLYWFCLLMFWSYPDLTADRLMFNIMWTAWVVVGTVLEERDLVAAIGEPYREYQGRVPILIPYRLRPAPCVR